MHYAVFLRKETFALTLIENEKCNAQARDSKGFSALYWSCKRSTPKVTSALLNKGCDPNEHDVYGMTPLFAAVSSNKKGNVEALLSHPCINVNQRNQFGGSALHHTGPYILYVII